MNRTFLCYLWLCCVFLSSRLPTCSSESGLLSLKEFCTYQGKWLSGLLEAGQGIRRVGGSRKFVFDKLKPKYAWTEHRTTRISLSSVSKSSCEPLLLALYLHWTACFSFGQRSGKAAIGAMHRFGGGDRKYRHRITLSLTRWVASCLTYRLSFISSMGFCMLVVCGLNKLASVVRYNKKKFNENTNVQSVSRVGTKESFKPSSRVSSYMLHKVLLSGIFLLIGLFCWKDVVRNRVWSNRETLFR